MNYDIQRFLKAQEEPYSGYQQALSEIQDGRKRGHWIWYIFPQMKGLGYSYMSDFYGISGKKAAQEIVNIVKNRIPKAYHYSTNDIQVLAPMQRSVVGATNLNIILQEAINPEGDCLSPGTTKTLAYSVHNMVVLKRNMKLKERLKSTQYAMK